MAQNNVYAYTPPRLSSETPNGRAFSIVMKDFWIQNGQAEIDACIETVLKPELSVFTVSQLDALEKVGVATQTRAGVIKMATPEEAWQGVECDIALSPQRAAGAYVDKATFNRFQDETRERLLAKATPDVNSELTAVIAALEARVSDSTLLTDFFNNNSLS